MPAPMAAPRAAPWAPSVSYSSIVAPVVAANASRNSGLQEQVGSAGAHGGGVHAHLAHHLEAVGES